MTIGSELQEYLSRRLLDLRIRTRSAVVVVSLFADIRAERFTSSHGDLLLNRSFKMRQLSSYLYVAMRYRAQSHNRLRVLLPKLPNRRQAPARANFWVATRPRQTQTFTTVALPRLCHSTPNTASHDFSHSTHNTHGDLRM
jgi:hypothetical protein